MTDKKNAGKHAGVRGDERQRQRLKIRDPLRCSGSQKQRSFCGVSAPHDAVLLFRQKDPKPWAPGEGKSAGRMRCGPYNWGAAAPAGALRWRHGMARLQISATSALSAIVVAPSHAACRGRQETDSVMRWRGYKEGGPHEMRPLQLKIQARRWIPDQVRDDRGGQADPSLRSG